MRKLNTTIPKLVEVGIDKLVHGGQGIGTADDGRKVFAWNALPSEKVVVEVSRYKKNYLEGIAIDVLEPSGERVKPLDEAYLSTSPWQIMTFEAENRYKQEILAETFAREHVSYERPIGFIAGKNEWHYRNKMEYSFWGDDDGLHLALFHRASHGKRIITGSSIAMPVIDEAANKIIDVLNSKNVRASQLKTVVIRASQKGEVVAALFVKDDSFSKIKELSGLFKGLIVYFSNPKSPASVITHELYSFGDITLSDELLDVRIKYDVNSFFQVNLPVFEQASKSIRNFVTDDDEDVIDMYSGVGTLGLLVGATKALPQNNLHTLPRPPRPESRKISQPYSRYASEILRDSDSSIITGGCTGYSGTVTKMVEIDAGNVEMAKQNTMGKNIDVVLASAEAANEQINSTSTIIFDPPRAGLHQKVIERIKEVCPRKIAYLSCNPITQARDIALLQDLYEIKSIEGYNFFPKTPHIECLALLSLR